MNQHSGFPFEHYHGNPVFQILLRWLMLMFIDLTGTDKNVPQTPQTGKEVFIVKNIYGGIRYMILRLNTTSTIKE